MVEYRRVFHHVSFFFGTIYLTNPNGRARLPPSRNPVFLRANGSAGASPSRTRELGFVKYIVPFFSPFWLRDLTDEFFFFPTTRRRRPNS